MYNTWDYKVGDLIQVEMRGLAPEIGVVTLFLPKGEGPELTRDYWEWVSVETGRTMFFKETKAYTLGIEHKVKRLARA